MAEGGETGGRLERLASGPQDGIRYPLKIQYCGGKSLRCSYLFADLADWMVYSLWRTTPANPNVCKACYTISTSSMTQ